jgi:MYXO-CTERM domain-containing protein
VDAGTDAAMAIDASSEDSGSLDSGVDAAVMDSGVDSGSSGGRDSGVDGGVPDSGSTDASEPSDAARMGGPDGASPVDSSAGPGGEQPAGDNSGCGCRTVDAPSESSPLALMSAAAIVGVLALRRRRARPRAVVRQR